MAITVPCPSCGTMVKAPDRLAGKRVKCPSCAAAVPVPEDDENEGPSIRRDGTNDVVETFIPYKNGKALAAYYFGVFSLIPCVGLILGPIALVLGILGVRYATAHPRARGMGHAIAGIVLGGLTTLGNWGLVLIFVISLLLGGPGRH